MLGKAEIYIWYKQLDNTVANIDLLEKHSGSHAAIYTGTFFLQQNTGIYNVINIKYSFFKVFKSTPVVNRYTI